MKNSDAQKLDRLLAKILKTKSVRNLPNTINFKDIELEGIQEKEIKDLLFKLRMEHQNLPDRFFQGTLQRILPNKPYIVDFLEMGGFTKISKERRKIKRRENIMFWMIIAGTLISLFSLLIILSSEIRAFINMFLDQ